MKKQIVVASVLVLLVCPQCMTPAQANPIAAPACKDIPSCGVAGIIIGTEIIGGVLYYIVKNAAGAIHKVRAIATTPPAHRTTEPGRHNVGDKVTLTGKLVSSRQKCEERAHEYGRDTDGGEWEVVDYEVIGAGSPGTIDPLGNVNERPVQYRCIIRKVR